MVPPTPATGIQKAQLPSHAEEGSEWSPEESPVRHSRPSAPALELKRNRSEPAFAGEAPSFAPEPTHGASVETADANRTAKSGPSRLASTGPARR